MIIAIDPGINGTGLAFFSGRGELLRAEYARCPLKADADILARCVAMGREVSARYDLARSAHPLESGPTRIVAEWPRVYEAGKAKRGADPNDLLPLAGVDAAAAAFIGCDATSVAPRDWKGTMGDMPDGSYLPETRIMGDSRGEGGSLSIVERARVILPSAASLAHNVIDSVGIGLHAVGRSLVADRERVIAR